MFKLVDLISRPGSACVRNPNSEVQRKVASRSAVGFTRDKYQG